MTVINMPDPLSAASTAVEGYTEGRDKAMALALAREKQQNDQRNETRSLDIQQKNVDSEIASRGIADKIAQATEEARERMEPFVIQAAKDAHTASVDASAQAHAELAQTTLINEAKKVELDLQKKYGPQMAQQALKQAVATLQQTAAQTIQTQHATANADAAAPGQRALTAAETAETQHAANAPYGVGRGGAGGVALSPQAQAIVDAYSQDGDMKKALLKASKLPKEYKAIEAELKTTEGLTKTTGAITPAQRGNAVRGAVAQLNAQGLKLPNDPHINTILDAVADPTTRDQALNDPNMPPQTKAYVTKFAALLP